MKSLKNLVNSSLVAITLMFATSFAANAIVIKQDIIGNFYGKIGTVEVEIKQSALNTGLLSTAFGDNISMTIELTDLYSWGDVFDVFFEEVEIDSDNLAAGVQFFSWDADDVGFGALTWNYQMFYDAGTDFGFLDVFDLSGNLVDFDSFTLGAAEVSAPATVALLTLAMGLMFVRRKRML